MHPILTVKFSMNVSLSFTRTLGIEIRLMFFIYSISLINYKYKMECKYIYLIRLYFDEVICWESNSILKYQKKDRVLIIWNHIYIGMRSFRWSSKTKSWWFRLKVDNIISLWKYSNSLIYTIYFQVCRFNSKLSLNVCKNGQ